MSEYNSSGPLLTKPSTNLWVVDSTLYIGHCLVKMILPSDQVDMVQKLPVEGSLLSQPFHSLRKTASHHDHGPRG